MLKKRIAKVIQEFRKGELPAGKSGTIVTYPKKGIVITQSE